MSATGVGYMLEQMNRYFATVKAKLASGGAASFRTLTGSVPANGNAVIDAPTQLGFNAADYHVYSLGVELRMVDPFITPNPPVTDATAVLTYRIAADGKVTILNNHTAAVTYHIRITMPVKK